MLFSLAFFSTPPKHKQNEGQSPSPLGARHNRQTVEDTSLHLAEVKQTIKVARQTPDGRMTDAQVTIDALGEPGEHEDVNPTNVLGGTGHHHHHTYDDKDPTSALIAEAAAAAMEVEIPVEDVDVTAAALAAQVGGHEPHDTTSNQVVVAAKKNHEPRRKRYRGDKADDEGHDGKKVKPAPGGSVASQSHEEALAARRLKDRQRYANMTPDQRQQYNAKRREQYHRQSENSRQKRRERERVRYHSLTSDAAKDRNARRAKLERERYQKLTPEELEAKNRKRRERAAAARQKKEAEKNGEKRLSEEVEAAVHHAVKVGDQNDMPLPPDAVVFDDKVTEEV